MMPAATCSGSAAAMTSPEPLALAAAQASPQRARASGGALAKGMLTPSRMGVAKKLGSTMVTRRPHGALSRRSESLKASTANSARGNG